MRIYFVRHGETEDDAKRIVQSATSVLSETGIKQAEALANRFKNIPVETIITSPYERAKQTAEIINKVIGKEIIVQELLSEYKKPSELGGKSMDDPETKKIKQLLFDHAEEPDWRYSDEETFSDLKKRGTEILKYLSDLKHEDILVVSHGAVIRMVFSLMMFAEDLTSKEFFAIQNFFGFGNTGISIAIKGGYIGWKMEAWNDTTHL